MNKNELINVIKLVNGVKNVLDKTSDLKEDVIRENPANTYKIINKGCVINDKIVFYIKNSNSSNINCYINIVCCI